MNTLSRRLIICALAACALLPSLSFGADDKTLRVAINGLPPEKGNAFSNIQTPSILLIGGIFDGLTRMTKQGGVDPWLATSWHALPGWQRLGTPWMS